MQIRSTRNTLIGAFTFTILSGLSALGTATIPEVSIDSTRVSYADLNLSESGDAQTLYSRLRRAAANVCEDTHKKPLSELVDQRECTENALSKAVEKVGSDTLKDIHRS